MPARWSSSPKREARTTLRHSYIGTEHILLGLLREEEGLAARVLESLDITVERARAEVLRIIGAGEEVSSGQIPFTPRAQKVLELALREALSLGHNYIGTEHILLGLTRENEGVAARILLDLNADAEMIRDEMLRILSVPEARRRQLAKVTRRPAYAGPGVLPLDSAWFDFLGAFLDDLTVEIRHELKREPDTGDLLLALEYAPGTLASQALRELGINLDELSSTIKRIRAQALPTEEDRIEEVRRSKELALESQQFETASRLRDEERLLTAERRRRQAAVLQEIRRHIGIPTRPDTPPQQPEPS